MQAKPYIKPVILYAITINDEKCTRSGDIYIEKRIAEARANIKNNTMQELGWSRCYVVTECTEDWLKPKEKVKFHYTKVTP